MNKNYFNFNNKTYDELRSRQNSDRLSSTAGTNTDSKQRSAAPSGDIDLGGGKFYNPYTGKQYDMNEANKFYDEAMGATNKNWGHYGAVGASGNVFGDDFKWKDGVDAYAKDYWQNGKDAMAEYDRYKKAAEDSYNKVINQADRGAQQASIQKMFAMKNAQDTNNIMGRGGAGADESTARAMSTNFDNKVGGLYKAVDEDMDSISKNYTDIYEKMKTNHQRNEEAAKSAYSDVLHEDIGKKLYGKFDSVLEAYANDVESQGAYTDLAGTEKAGFDYLKKEKEDELLNYINSQYSNNDYFMQDSASKKLMDEYTNEVKQHGSGNQDYMDYNTDKATRDAQAKAEAEQAKTENYAQRGALTNVADTYRKVLLDTTVKIDGEEHCLSVLNSSKKLEKKAPDKIKGKIEGDVIEYKDKKYVLYKGQWKAIMQ